MTVLVTGGTGWVGRHLIPRLNECVVVSRNAARAVEVLGNAPRIVQCDLPRETIPPDQLDGVTAVVNLLGDPIADGRWTEQKKQRIRDSRVLGTRHLVESLLHLETLPDTVVSASAIGYYGDRGDEICTESTPPSTDFLGEVCVQWEQACRPLVEAGARVVWPRLGIVLGRGGGAVEKMLPPFRLGAGGRIGSGRQWMSWIHLHDLLELILFSLHNSALNGPVNAVSPAPVRNSEFTQALGQALHRPAFLSVPQFALRIMMGEFADYLAASQRVLPQAMNESGFRFRYPTIDVALQEIVTDSAVDR